MPSAEFVAKSNPDGYTILQYTTTLAVNTVLQKAVPYDLFEDFTPLALACEAPLVLITPGISSNRKLTDLIEYAKSKPNGVAFGHGGVGSMSHLASELLKRSLGFEAVSVPYKGNAPAMNDLIGGRLDYYFSTISDVLPNIRSGNLNALATTSELRDRSLPNVPTMVELGYKDFTPVVTWGYLAPKNIPAAAARQLQDAILKAMNTPSVRDRLESVSATARYAAGAEALTSRMRAEIDRWKPVIKSAGISPN